MNTLYNYNTNFLWKQILIDNELVFIKFWIKLNQFFVKITGGLKLLEMTVLPLPLLTAKQYLS